MPDWDELHPHFGSWGLGSFLGGLVVIVLAGLFKLIVHFARKNKWLDPSGEMMWRRELIHEIQALRMEQGLGRRSNQVPVGAGDQAHESQTHEGQTHGGQANRGGTTAVAQTAPPAEGQLADAEDGEAH